MEFAERSLAKKALSSANPLVLQVLNELDVAVVPKYNNAVTNRKLWDTYSKEWSSSTDWVQRMAKQVNMEDDLRVLGDEWSSRSDKEHIVSNFILPYVDRSSRVAEIGRIAMDVYGKVGEFHCYDISERMLLIARHTLESVMPSAPASFSAPVFHLVGEEPCLGGQEMTGYFDFIYAFDVFPHVNLHVLYRYLLEIRRTLRPGTGRAFFSTADVTSPVGFERFSAQKSETVAGFCFTSPECVLHLIQRAGLSVVTTGSRDESNIYLNRDFLVVVRCNGDNDV